MPLDSAEIHRRMDFVASVDEDTTEACEAVRKGFILLGTVLAEGLPESREKSLAITALEEGLYWAIGSLVRPAQ